MVPLCLTTVGDFSFDGIRSSLASDKAREIYDDFKSLVVPYVCPINFDGFMDVKEIFSMSHIDSLLDASINSEFSPVLS